MKILSRNEFINEVYEPMLEEKEYRELQAINEGLLKNLFGRVMFDHDWNSVKGDKSIKDVYKEMDKSLSGFSTMKYSKRSQCNKIRQELVNFACEWYDYKMNKAKENDEDPKIAKSMEFKDDTLAENLETTKKKIKDITNGDKLMMKWADMLLDDMKTVINRVVMNEIDDEEIRKEVEAEEKKEQEKKDKINKEMESYQNKVLQDMEKRRNDQISNTGAIPINESLLGDKAIQNICKSFNELQTLMINESLENNETILNEGNSPKINKKKVFNTLNKDTVLGLKKIFQIPGDPKSFKIDDNFKTTYKLMKMFYDDKTGLANKDNTDKFKEVPGLSVQAMCIGVNSFLKNAVYGNDDYADELPLMTSCAIISNGLISYNLPMSKDGENNYFTEVLSNYSKMKSNKDLKLPDDFKKNADAIFNKIVNEAKKQKEMAEKEYDAEVEKLDLK